MTAPTDRDALIEVMARALCEADGIDPSGWDYRDPTGSAYNWHMYKDDAIATLTALESSGCFIGPVVATPDMVTNTKTCDMRKQGRFYDIWTAMQSANPYRKDHTNDR